jgi:hypothetical protein
MEGVANKVLSDGYFILHTSSMKREAACSSETFGNTAHYCTVPASNSTINTVYVNLIYGKGESDLDSKPYMRDLQ